jgi:ADP-ribosylglycohydrolase
MLGLAVGDALGAAVEWLHPDQITSRYGGPLRDMVASGMWALG